MHAYRYSLIPKFEFMFKIKKLKFIKLFILKQTNIYNDIEFNEQQISCYFNLIRNLLFRVLKKY